MGGVPGGADTPTHARQAARKEGRCGSAPDRDGLGGRKGRGLRWCVARRAEAERAEPVRRCGPGAESSLKMTGSYCSKLLNLLRDQNWLLWNQDQLKHEKVYSR
ncbi:hypothetical protein AV530_014458 [Patagioenas fasciata monilis]|uniref:Uncharacterized protein n=1 Tax=Patagioenas fasciata monilis TaxID=372326 RepID=A0A1V4KBS1_PATFA|nr:hypothetical protein AV530_014458 [Patagioenas fasciata monilis]